MLLSHKVGTGDLAAVLHEAIRCGIEKPDGRRCGSRWQLEVDHVDSAARGGKATLDRLRLLCRRHNILHVEEVYGKAFMEKYRGGESTIDGGGWRAERASQEAPAAG